MSDEATDRQLCADRRAPLEAAVALGQTLLHHLAGAFLAIVLLAIDPVARCQFAVPSPASVSVFLLLPKHQLGHPDNYLFVLSNIIFAGSITVISKITVISIPKTFCLILKTK